jgi:hypothetical protein
MATTKSPKGKLRAKKAAPRKIKAAPRKTGKVVGLF